jgi:RNA polymerase sigma factor (sigma-70 family)
MYKCGIRGSQMTFEVLLKRISPKLKGIAYKLNGHYPFFNDQDLFQEALLRLWQEFRAGKLEDKTDSYILQGCYFYLKNYIRKINSRSRAVSLEDFIGNEEDLKLEETLLLQDCPPQDYFDYLNSKLLAETIYNNGFTEREKNILKLYAEGLTTRQIGSRIGISHVRVVKLMSRIREKSKIYLDNF